MDLLTIIGITGAWGCALGSVLLEGGGLSGFVNVPAMILVFGGTFFATTIGFTMHDLLAVPRVTLVAFFEKKEDPIELIKTLVNYAKLARREGLLILEKQSKNITDPFLKKGVQLLVDGVDSEQVRSIMETDLALLSQRHKEGERFFKEMGGYAPTLGVIGTVMGLVNMLANLSDPGTMGPAIAGAFIATLYGVSSANLLFLPLANKLKTRHTTEMLIRRIILEGAIAIQVGDNPKVIEEKLASFLPPKIRIDLAAALKRK
jgi:chemotaxis protein MotA